MAGSDCRLDYYINPTPEQSTVHGDEASIGIAARGASWSTKHGALYRENRQVAETIYDRVATVLFCVHTPGELV